MKYSPDYCSRFRILKGGKISLVVSALIASVSMVQAAPSGGVVTAGSASIAQSGSVTNITQSTNKAAINWQNFSIGTSETVNFNQPTVSSVTLNRVVGNEKSVIDGALNANGQVFILNSNGVLFSKNASINTAGLVATTMNLSDADFMNGNYSFKGDSQASVINQGTINISDKGYAALFGKEVKNEGFIKATLGKVELVGAKEVTLNINGNSLVNLKVDKGVLDALVENKGAIYADGGEVYLTTNAVNELLKGVVNNTGIIEANSIDDITGKIELYAHGGTTNVSGTLEAKGGFIETSGETLHVSKDVSIKAKEWLLDPTNITIADGGTDSIGGSTMDADTVTAVLNGGTDVTLQADQDITVNESIIWSSAKKLTLTSDTIHVNDIIKNTNTTNGGVYFNATNTTTKVIFGASGLVSIYNAYQLQWMNQALAGKYEIGSNINLNGFTWTPIGHYNTGPFTGNFDGLGHTISNLTFNDTARDFAGFFGATRGALVQNVGLINVDITAGSYVGGLVGNNDMSSTIKNAYVTGSVHGNSTVGGLVGENSNSSTIENSYAQVAVEGFTIVGGLVGHHSSSAQITNSYASGTVSGTLNLGGLSGANSGTITNSYYDNQANNVGTMGDTGFGKTKAQLLALVTGGTWNNTTIWGANGSAVEGYANVTLPFLRSVTKFDNTLFAGGFGTSDTPYTITNWTQLQNINYNTATLNKYYTLSNNINSATAGYTNSGAGFVPIGGNPPAIFTGTFDGQGHTISDLYINRPSMTLVGLFGYSYVATIRNIGLLNVNITGWDLTGGLAGMFNNGTITNAYVTGRVRGNGTMNVVGGLAGGIENSTITSSYATVDVISSSNYVGGLVGAAYDTSLITNSYATGSVTGATSVGGLVGILNGTSSITNSYATGSVTGTTFAGGLLGSFSSGGAVTNSYWNTQTSGKTNSAGFAVGKTTEEMMNSSMYTGWGILEDTTLAKNYPTLRMASSGNVWVIGTKSTPTPDPTPNITPIITQIVNGTAITPPVLPNFVLPTPPVQAPQQFSFGGQMVQLVSIPSTDVASQLVGTKEARAMIQGADVGDLRIPLGQNSQIQLVNGGVHLPNGIEQEFFMAQR